jgi:hypothetical protein
MFLSQNLFTDTSLNFNPTDVSNLLADIFGVAFHTSDPDKSTLENVKRDLQENGIDITQLPFRTRDHCQQV